MEHDEAAALPDVVHQRLLDRRREFEAFVVQHHRLIAALAEVVPGDTQAVRDVEIPIGTMLAQSPPDHFLIGGIVLDEKNA